MKITYLEMGLMKIQAETESESQAINGIVEMCFKFMPPAIANYHGCTHIKGRDLYLNWCVIPDGSMTWEGDNLKPGIDKNIESWRKLQWDHKFKAAQKPLAPVAY